MPEWRPTLPFRYRYRLDAHRGHHVKVVVAGGTGHLGSALVGALERAGHGVTVLTRSPTSDRQVAWTPDGSAGDWASVVDGADAVVNLAGASIAGSRWTDDYKATIDNSRIHATRSLANAIKAAARPPAAFLSGSAVGYYGPRGEETLTEEAAAGTDFLATVCNQWEWEAQQVPQATRVVLLRTGLVLDGRSGALPQIVRPFRMLAGGPVGSGHQYWSWIHIDDWVGIALRALESSRLSGPVNVTAPHPATNAEFAHMVGLVLKVPSLVRTPGFVLRAVLGEMAEPLLLSGQRALPQKAHWDGYAFRFPDLKPALDAALI